MAAGALLAAHRGRFPGSPLIGMAAARLALSEGNRPLALAELETAARLAPSHPWIPELIASLESGRSTGSSREELGQVLAQMGIDRSADEEETDLPEEADGDAADLVSPSLAALYRSQGHLDQALAAYTRLARLNPDDHSLAATRDELEVEIAASVPTPFSSGASGGESVAGRMARLAAARPAVSRRAVEGYDSFYRSGTPEGSPDTGDYEAFRRWLEELER